MTGAIICARCPREHQSEVSQICKAKKIMKAFTAASFDIVQWESQVLMATVGLVEERDAKFARILCIEDAEVNGPSHNRLVQAIRAALAVPDFSVFIETVDMTSFRKEFGMDFSGDVKGRRLSNGKGWSLDNEESANSANSKGAYSFDNVSSFTITSSGKGRGNGKGFTARNRSPSVKHTQQSKRSHSMRPSKRNHSDQEDLVVVWVCGECSALFETHELLADHQQSESHWNATLADCGRRFVSKAELESLSIIRTSERTDPKIVDSAPVGCEVFDLGEEAPSRLQSKEDLSESRAPAAAETQFASSPSLEQPSGCMNAQPLGSPASRSRAFASNPYRTQSLESSNQISENMKGQTCVRQIWSPRSGRGAPIGSPGPAGQSSESINTIGENKQGQKDGRQMWSPRSGRGGPIGAPAPAGSKGLRKGSPSPSLVPAKGSSTSKGQAFRRAQRSPTRAGKGNTSPQPPYGKSGHSQAGTRPYSDRWADLS